MQATYEAVLEELMRSDPTQLHLQLRRWPLHLYLLRALGTSLRSFIDERKALAVLLYSISTL